MGYNEYISLLLKEHHKKEHTIATHIADGIPPEKKCKKNILRNEAALTIICMAFNLISELIKNCALFRLFLLKYSF